MTTPTTPEERAARLAALRAARTDRPTTTTGTTPVTDPTPATSVTHRRPARVAKIATVGLSVTATLGLMAAYGLSEEAEAAPEPGPTTGILPTTSSPAPGTLRVAVDAEAIVLVVDASGAPIDLVHLASVTELRDFLAQATPIIPTGASATAPADSRPASGPTQVPPTSAAVPPAIPAPAPTSPPTPALRTGSVDLSIPVPTVATGRTAGS